MALTLPKGVHTNHASLQLASAKDTTSPKLPRNEHAVAIEHTRTWRGFGLYATKDLPKDHKILLERPLMTSTYFRFGRHRIHTADESWKKLSQVQRAELRGSFRKLRSLPLGRTLERLERRRLEKFIMEYSFRDLSRDSDAHIFKFACHINHACSNCANAISMVDSAWPNRITVKLRADVKVHQEILIPYGKKVSFRCAICQPSKFRLLVGYMLQKCQVWKVKGEDDDS